LSILFTMYTFVAKVVGYLAVLLFLIVLRTVVSLGKIK